MKRFKLWESQLWNAVLKVWIWTEIYTQPWFCKGCWKQCGPSVFAEVGNPDIYFAPEWQPSFVGRKLHHMDHYQSPPTTADHCLPSYSNARESDVCKWSTQNSSKYTTTQYGDDAPNMEYGKCCERNQAKRHERSLHLELLSSWASEEVWKCSSPCKSGIRVSGGYFRMSLRFRSTFHAKGLQILQVV